MITIEELTRPTTPDEAFEQFLSIVEGTGLPVRTWKRGRPLRVILRVVATAYANFTQTVAEANKAGFRTLAKGGWATLNARYGYNVERIVATFATGELTLYNSGGGLFELEPGELRAINGATGKAYTNTTAVTLGPGATIAIPIRAVEIGTPSNAAPLEIDELETVLPGVSCSNHAAVVGSDDETDEDLAQRSLDKLGTLSPSGPRGAYAFAVRSATRPDGSPVNINRVRVSPSSSTGTVTIHVASPAGPPNVDDVAYAADSVEALARPDTVTATVLAATPVPVARTLTVWARRTNGVSGDDIKTLVEAALARELAVYPIGGIPKPPTQLDGYLYADFIAGVAKAAHPSIYDVDGASPDLPLAPGQVAILSSSVTVRLVDV